jgi:hypothetical protein
MVCNMTYTPVPITLGSKSVTDVAKSVIDYLEAPTKNRISDYDFAAYQRRLNFASGASDTRITRETIKSAQYLSAEFDRSLGMKEEDAIDFAYEWFKKQEATAPWQQVAASTTFVGADPRTVGRAYDAMCALWYHFFTGRPTGIGGTQINKVLHQVLPELVVIYDTRLSELYEGMSFKAEVKKARNAQDETNKWNKKDRFSWEPLRRDMEKITPAKEANIRQGVAELPCKNAIIIEGKAANIWASENLSLVRLIDMVAWQ